MKLRAGISPLSIQGVDNQSTTGWWHETSNFRKFVPQLLVTTINNFLLMDLSMMLAFPTLVIGALYQPNNPHYTEQGLYLTSDEASWLGSLVYIFQPLGSTVSGVITEPLGRKRSMMMVNITPLVGWLMLHFAQSVAQLYAANAVLGLGIGFMEAPVLTYVGEISEPRLRSLLTAYTGVLAQIGYLLVYLLGATMDWRTAAGVCASVPVISFLTMLVVPESPLWLLARDRHEEAEKALCYLRGWVRPEVVKEELASLVEYVRATQNWQASERADVEDSCGGRVKASCCNLLERFRNLGRQETLRPLMLVVSFFFIFHSSGMSGVRPYMVNIIKEFELPVDPHWATVMTAVLGLLAIILLTVSVTRVGKRVLSLVSVAGCALSCLTMGAYAYGLISGPSGATTPRPFTWLPFMAFIALSFFTYFGVGQIPWMYVAEVFPLRSRGLASGVTAAMAYVLYFTAAKTYLQLESALTLHGVFWLYAAFGTAGFVFLYKMLPETEGKTLEEVEEYFQPAKKRKSQKASGADPALSPEAVHCTHM